MGKGSGTVTAKLDISRMRTNQQAGLCIGRTFGLQSANGGEYDLALVELGLDTLFPVGLELGDDRGEGRETAQVPGQLEIAASPRRRPPPSVMFTLDSFRVDQAPLEILESARMPLSKSSTK